MAALADWLAGRIRSSSPKLREFVMRNPWGRLVAAVIFALMPRRLRPASAAGLDLVVRWQVEGQPTRYLIVRDGRASVRKSAEREQDLTLAMAPVTLLDLATGAANGPQLFMTGRVKITGDLMLAQRVASLFSVPG